MCGYKLLYYKGYNRRIEKNPLKLVVSPYKIRVFGKKSLTWPTILGMMLESSFAKRLMRVSDWVRQKIKVVLKNESANTAGR